MIKKNDSDLGFKVRDFLIQNNLENPIKDFNKYSYSDKMDIISKKYAEIMSVLGLDLSNDSLEDTPKRIAKMLVFELFEGLDYNNFPKCTTTENTYNYNQPLTVENIDVSSVCEHHFQNIKGKCTITYKPNKKTLGLSKFNRVVRFFSKRPQVQERLTVQISKVLCFILETEVTVTITAKHDCVICRGIEDKDSQTTTTYTSHNLEF